LGTRLAQASSFGAKRRYARIIPGGAGFTQFRGGKSFKA
jgi:hypothetical protein